MEYDTKYTESQSRGYKIAHINRGYIRASKACGWCDDAPSFAILFNDLEKRIGTSPYYHYARYDSSWMRH